MCFTAALGYFIAAISPNMDIANAGLPAYITVLLFFVGQLLRNQDQPVYWRWFSYLDFLKYAWGAQMINQFEGSKAMALDFQTVRDPMLACIQGTIYRSCRDSFHVYVDEKQIAGIPVFSVFAWCGGVH